MLKKIPKVLEFQNKHAKEYINFLENNLKQKENKIQKLEAEIVDLKAKLIKENEPHKSSTNRTLFTPKQEANEDFQLIPTNFFASTSTPQMKNRIGLRPNSGRVFQSSNKKTTENIKRAPKSNDNIYTQFNTNISSIFHDNRPKTGIRDRFSRLK
eukprot:TRINITY_DN459_c0_g1_i1.p1 TRINITY_DN459_c0_g1~~TRINITY_DN459_c0_g1_i1.p1  ORF type:complete len:155 (-),score=34.04 TRINITY_DN459_c0_g1_i1:19-483(-)